ncbi:hypothetical protein BJ993_000638 [Nocardioides aromaticivorans]|uniref:Septum formation-related domain-containing protein n=1 Tax=Nocardioides aromaticivorans TaxID=200618 RepID=A0A7Z0CM14_9ACTN|nr:hypothetical protein [Nocardioides aromaticivorans]NYI43558.1 hypothetical protein [Nocardioides aromaticivorans]
MSAADWSRPGAHRPPSVGGHAPATVTDATAGWALAWSILSCCYIGNVVSTVMALRVLSHARLTGEDRGKGLAIAALAINALGLGSLVVTGYVLAVFGTSETTTAYDALPPVNADPAVVMSIGDLEYGDCLVDPSFRDEEGDVRRVECDTRHDVEVFEMLPVDVVDFPGEKAIERRARACYRKAFSTFVGIAYARSELEVTWFAPSSEGWSSDLQYVACLLVDPKGPLDESLYHAQR